MVETIKTLLSTAKQRLREAGIETDVLDATILLQKALNISRETLIKEPEKSVPNEVVVQFREMLARRINHEPIAYIVGKKEFYGRDFEVTSATLIPRPDSEVLIDAILKHLPKEEKIPIRVIDLGTGSGCLLLTILAEIEGSSGVGVDISPEAILVAQKNAQKLGLAKRVEFRINDWRTDEIRDGFDVVISNPPYIKKNDISGLHPNVYYYEPHTALDGGLDGLECYRQLARVIAQILKPSGMVFLECGLGQHQDVVEIFNQQKFKLVSFEKDLAGINRCIIMH